VGEYDVVEASLSGSRPYRALRRHELKTTPSRPGHPDESRNSRVRQSAEKVRRLEEEIYDAPISSGALMGLKLFGYVFFKIIYSRYIIY